MGKLDASCSLFSFVGSIHPDQRLVVEALDAHAQAFDAQAFPGEDVGFRKVFGVGLQRDFLQGVQPQTRRQPFHQACQLLGGQQGWRAPTEVQRRPIKASPPFRPLNPKPRFLDQAVDHVVHPLQGGGEVEVAVVASLSAEWNVDVDPSHGPKVELVGRTFVPWRVKSNGTTFEWNGQVRALPQARLGPQQATGCGRC